MIDQIKQLKSKALIEISQAKDLSSLDKIWRKYLGRQDGQLTKILRSIKDLSKEEKFKVGALANEVKGKIEKSVNQKKHQLLTINNQQSTVSSQLSITLPGKKIELGRLHPLTQARYKVAEIFSSMGFEILEGRELETDYYNFEALNIPEGHPARDMWDTFYVKSKRSNHPQPTKNQKSKLLLRTHTSPMQVRVMEKKKPPLKVCVIGKCFRHEATDASHEHTLYQIEGFVVDKEISVANLIYTLKSFLNVLFKREVKIRLRPSYFPFTEPSFEMDFACLNCQGKGCPACSQTGWVEILGSGMIHPKVYEYAGYPKDVYTGFAFGVGLDRLVMMKHKIDDIRWFHRGDLRFIKQF
ncbi:phenylalanine--tRNA ligase subunit alpha [Patescibacteria group bacterium]|nr:phenylalanine--tRNA ligase subunit alpha [Patescibacteria group bacterium]